MHSNNHDGICHATKTKHEDGCKQKLRQKKDFNDVKKPKYSKTLVVGTKAFMQVAKKGDAFFIYALPMLNVEPRQHEILSQYQEFKDMFKKKNVNTLLKHWPYDYAIDLEKGA
jgi:hypothetical protein